MKAYFSQVLKELEASIQSAKKEAETKAYEDKKRSEELQITSSSSQDEAKKCEKKCKIELLLKKFSPELLSKLMEYNLDPNSLSPRAAISKLLTLGMPVEHVIVDLNRSGKDISNVQNILEEKGLGSHLNIAISKGLENRSMAAAVDYAENLIGDA